MSLTALFDEKKILLERFLALTRQYKAKLQEEGISLDQKLDWVDEITDHRESNLKAMQALDAKIEIEKLTLNIETIEKLQGEAGFREVLSKTLELIKEIQLTDQSLFLYIQSMGSELRAQILKSLKEKEAVSKFKSQSQTPTGDELDQTV